MNKLLVLFINLIPFALFAQTPIPIDKVTLHDSTEYVGFIFEQIPGEKIRIRTLNMDTVSIPMNTIYKYSKLVEVKKNHLNPNTQDKRKLRVPFVKKNPFFIELAYLSNYYITGNYNPFSNLSSRALKGTQFTIGFRLKGNMVLRSAFSYLQKFESNNGNIHESAFYDHRALSFDISHIFWKSKKNSHEISVGWGFKNIDMTHDDPEVFYWQRFDNANSFSGQYQMNFFIRRKNQALFLKSGFILDRPWHVAYDINFGDILKRKSNLIYLQFALGLKL